MTKRITRESLRKFTPEKFWAKSIPDHVTGCRIWAGPAAATRVNGTNRYGTQHFKGKNRSAHRVAWQLFYGPIPEGMCILHKCDRSLCVEPLHLFLGTNQDNMDDMAAKGRARPCSSPGSKNPHAKLTEQQVIEIRSKYDPLSYTARMLAVEYGIATSTVSNIARGAKWKHVPLNMRRKEAGEAMA